MNVSEMYTYVASLVDDPNFGYFTQPQLLRFINQSCRETQKRLIQAGNNWYLKVATRPTITNQADYFLPCDFLKSHRVELVTNPGINEQSYDIGSITIAEASFFNQTNTDVSAYFLRKDKMILVPYPKDASKTIRLTYTYKISEVGSSTATVDVPEEFHEYICYLSALKCFQKDGREASLIKNYTDEVERNLDKDAIERAIDHSGRVVSTSDDGFSIF